ncbi:ABC transporter ATP-binding protein [Elioraea sp.]|uniref:ABC transporter ATP-binding protein n=1 Tax=Elioraea sp. TaxID=2185103 RepID=UPI003F719D16
MPKAETVAEGVVLSGIAKSFGRTRVLEDVDLAIEPGEFLTLVGPSGCGKSTLLRIIAGLEGADRGSVAIGGRTVDPLPPDQRDVAMVFQSYALYPHMTVAGNMATPLEMRRLTLLERLPLIRLLSPRRPRVMRGIMAEVRSVAEQLRIAHLLDRKPAQLSGGQRQRVALGRAMVRRPRVFLMDEPLSNLDAALRVHMRSELAELHARLRITFIYVTHDQVEAMTMSSRVALMDRGRILQLGTPADLYDRPATLAVARFIGSPPINVIEGEADGACVRIDGVRLPIAQGVPAGTRVTVGIRPEALHPTSPRRDGPVLRARLKRAENLGAEWMLHATLAGAGDTPLVVRITAAEHDSAVQAGLLGKEIALAVAPSGTHLFGADGARIALHQLERVG